MTERRLRTDAGFTLLEVLVAIAILGLGLTVILSSQVGLFSSSQRSRNLSVAVGLARCRMSETEVVLLRDGYPIIDQNDTGPCCGDEDDLAFKCSWKIEVIELPQATDLAELGADGESAAPGLGPLGALGAAQQSGGSLEGGIGGLSELLNGPSGGGPASMVPLVMGLVYPDLKPMLEASIRKVTVTVNWTEGNNERDLSITQYVTNPQQGGLDPNAAAGIPDPSGAGGTSPAAPVPAPATPPPGGIFR